RLVGRRITPDGPYDTQMRRTECYAGCREPKAVTPLGVWGNSPHPLAETTPEFWIDPGTAGASGSRLIEGGTWNALTTLAIHVTDADTGDINRWADHFARPVRHRRALPDRRSGLRLSVPAPAALPASLVASRLPPRDAVAPGCDHAEAIGGGDHGAAVQPVDRRTGRPAEVDARRAGRRCPHPPPAADLAR